MQQPQNYVEERWRSVEDKLDEANKTLYGLSSDLRLVNQRVTNLENAPKEAQARLTLWIAGGGCLYMILSLCIMILGMFLTYYVSHH